jgi:hypothetical protein
MSEDAAQLLAVALLEFRCPRFDPEQFADLCGQ